MSALMNRALFSRKFAKIGLLIILILSGYSSRSQEFWDPQGNIIDRADINLLGSLNAYNIGFITNGVTRMTIDTLGNIGIGTTSPAAALDIASSTNGVLLPRLTTTQVNAISSPVRGLLLYDSTVNTFKYYNGSSWKGLNTVSGGPGGAQYSLQFNNGDSSFMGDSYVKDIGGILTLSKDANINGMTVGCGNRNDNSNTAFGTGTLSAVTTGYGTAFGWNALHSLTSGQLSVGVGYSALSSLTTGTNDVGIGAWADYRDVTGVGNTSIGTLALYTNTSGMYNTTVGYRAGYSTLGNKNTFVGVVTHDAGIGGSGNIGLGYAALRDFSGDYNIAIGDSAASNLNGGSGNIVIGNHVSVPNLSGSNQLNIGNAIYGINIGLTGTAIGINTTTPDSTLTILGGLKLVNGTQGAGKVLTSDSTGGAIWATPTGSQNLQQTTDIGNTTSNTLYITGNGGLGIGTTTIPAGFSLAVNGSAVFTQVKVKLYSNWPDYVFADNYALPPLQEVEQYIHQHKHLSGVPAAEALKKEGIDLEENQAALLKKVEELTLYIIQQDKRSIDQEATIRLQDKRIGELEMQNQQLLQLKSEIDALRQQINSK